MTISLRPRRPDDIPALTDVLARQQPASRYPHRWPLPFPAEDFVVRADQEQAWVAEVDGRVAGHVAVGPVGGDEAVAFLEATGRTNPASLALVAVLFVDIDVKGRGAGGRLLSEAVAWARERDRLPVLDVLQGQAVDVYEHLGWQAIGQLHPEWLAAELPPMLLMALPDVSPG